MDLELSTYQTGCVEIQFLLEKVFIKVLYYFCEWKNDIFACLF